MEFSILITDLKWTDWESAAAAVPSAFWLLSFCVHVEWLKPHWAARKSSQVPLSPPNPITVAFKVSPLSSLPDCLPVKPSQHPSLVLFTGSLWISRHNKKKSSFLLKMKFLCYKVSSSWLIYVLQFMEQTLTVHLRCTWYHEKFWK